MLRAMPVHCHVPLEGSWIVQVMKQGRLTNQGGLLAHGDARLAERGQLHNQRALCRPSGEGRAAEVLGKSTIRCTVSPSGGGECRWYSGPF